MSSFDLTARTTGLLPGGTIVRDGLPVIHGQVADM